MTAAPHWPLAALASVLALLACHSDPLDPESCAELGVVQQPFTKRCLSQSLDPITDQSNPEYGRVGCTLVSAWPAGSPECGCDTPGFAPVTADEHAFAAAQFEQSGSCDSACCGEKCFCELLQHSGTALAACQSRPGASASDDEPTGWCYVEPALGLGTDEDVASCPASDKRLIRYYPEGPRYSIHAALQCLGKP